MIEDIFIFILLECHSNPFNAIHSGAHDQIMVTFGIGEWLLLTICPRIYRDLEWPNHLDVRRQVRQMRRMGQEIWPLKDGSEFASWRSRSANVLSVFVESVISCFSLSLLVGPILVGGCVCGQKLLWQKLMSKHLASLQKMMRDHEIHEIHNFSRAP